MEQPSVMNKSNITSLQAIKDLPNVLFYLNKIQSRPQGDFIDKIHKYWQNSLWSVCLKGLFRKNDYKKLEIHHGYVQWLFPNFYGSAFNRDSHKLLVEEAKIFRENKEVFFGILSWY